MSRRAKPNRLNIWMNGIPVGNWEKTRQGERLAYFDDLPRRSKSGSGLRRQSN